MRLLPIHPPPPFNPGKVHTYSTARAFFNHLVKTEGEKEIERKNSPKIQYLVTLDKAKENSFPQKETKPCAFTGW